MTDYTITTNFGAKDSLPSGNAGKVIKGSEFTTEFTNIQTAVNTKADTAGDTFTGVVNFSDDVAVNTNTLFVDVSEAKVGIGTTSPQSNLHVAGSGIFQGTSTQIDLIETDVVGNNTRLRQTVGDFFIQTVDNSSANPVSRFNLDHATGDISFYEDTGTTPKFFWDASAESLGIGTTSPSTTLDVHSSTNGHGLYIAQDNAAFGYHTRLTFQGSNGSGGFNTIAGLKAYQETNGTNGYLRFDTNGDTERMRIDSSGNVGIGTDSLQRKLHVESEVRIQGTYPKLEFVDTDNNPDFTIIGGNAQLRFYDETNATSRMNIDSSGNVGIGTNSPDSILDVVGSDPILTIRDTSTSFADSHATLRLAESDGSGNVNVRYDVALDEGNLTFDFSDGATTSERMRIDSSGNLLVGTTDVVALNGGFSVTTGSVDYINVGHASSVASGNYYAAFRHGTNTIGTITQNGTTGVLYNTSSDERLKENITDSADAGSKVDAIQIRQFDWKADGSHQDYGVIAQELVTVAPEAVHQPVDEEDMMGVDYSKLVPMLIKEVQSLRSRVAELESE